ncbi:MAG: marine proteobacterial sortase target protein [Gammaproteobacteria bacterium]|nr:marine proteobacterial sortase target protein [Gammaproteobacteria bacterium]
MYRRPRISETFRPGQGRPVTRSMLRRSRGQAMSRFLTMLMLLAAAATLAAQAVSAAESEISAGTLLFRSDGVNIEAPRLETDVDISVNGMIARVNVHQSFRNDGVDFVEGVYVFPLPDDAAVDTLQLRIGERVIVGEIREKAEARKTYERAKESGQRASLVEQDRPNLFTTTVANIGPGETVEVRIGYLQTLRYVQGAFSLRFPMTVTPRYTPEQPEPLLAAVGAAPHACCVPFVSHSGPAVFHPPGQGNSASISVTIDAGFQLARLESLYHDFNTRQSGTTYILTPDKDRVAMNRDLELVWQPALGADPQVAVFTETWKGEDFALIMMMPPAEDAVVASMPREIIYVIDTSGSMGGSSIRQARAALEYAIDRLAPQDRFNVVRFSGSARQLYRYAVPADPSHKQHAIGFVRSLDADGGTNIDKALKLALDEQADITATADGYLRQVVFITDGSVSNEQMLFGGISRELGNTRLFTVGIGSAPNDWFMRKAAEFGRGTFTQIGADHMIEERMDMLLARLERPVLYDIKIEAPAGSEVWPQRIRDLYAGEPVMVRAKLSSLQGEFTVRGKQQHVPWQRKLSLGSKDDAAGVAALWGRGRIEALMDSVVTGADPDQVRAGVVQLALKYHLVSRYTSLVAVDRTPVRAPGTLMNRAVVPANAPAGSTMTGYPAGATPAALFALLGLFSLLLSGAGLLAGRRQ